MPTRACSRRTSRRTTSSATCSKGYAPYGVGGNLAKAKAEIKLSKYDTNHDGICDAKACKNVFTITGDRAVEKGFIPVLEQELGSIGITLKDRVLKDAYTPIGTVAQNVPVLHAPGLGQGLLRPVRVLRRELRRPRDHPDRQREPRPRRPHAVAGQDSSHIKGSTSERAERQRRPRQVPADRRQGRG